MKLAVDRDFLDTLFELLPWLVPVLIGLAAAIGRIAHTVAKRRAERVQRLEKETRDARSHRRDAPTLELPERRRAAEAPRRSVIAEIRRYLEQIEESGRRDRREVQVPAETEAPPAPVPRPRRTTVVSGPGRRAEAPMPAATPVPSVTGLPDRGAAPRGAPRKAALARRGGRALRPVLRPSALRRAVILAEVLAPPLAERHIRGEKGTLSPFSYTHGLDVHEIRPGAGAASRTDGLPNGGRRN